MIDIVLTIGLIGTVLAMAGCVYRIIKGPSLPDRTIALDTLGINLIGMTGLLSIKTDSQVFVDVMLLVGILAFIGTVAISKFLEKGVIIDRNRH